MRKHGVKIIQIFTISNAVMTTILMSFTKRAIKYWQNQKSNENRNTNSKHRSFKSVQHKFRRVSSERQLRRWEEQLKSDGNRLEKLSHISKVTHDKFNVAIQAELIIHDVDIRRWALEAQREIGNLNPVFKASST